MNQLEKILVVDDRSDIRDALSEHLKLTGFEILEAKNASEARTILDQTSFDLILLDIMMPGETGLSLCRHISETSETPVILLTALTDDMDKIVGLEIGADDYVTKPFNPRELVARIRSVIRRSQKGSVSKKGEVLQIGPWVINQRMCELVGPDDLIVPLSSGELKLLSVFAEHPDKVLSRVDLIELTKGRDLFPFERSIDNMVSRLRKKIEEDPGAPKFLRTVWGGGYKYSALSDEK